MRRFFLLGLAAAVAISACGWLEVSIASVTPAPPSPIAATPTALLTLSPVPTQPASEVSSSPTSISSPECNRAAFIDDVTAPDGTVYGPNTSFVKTWQIKNVGTCTWTPAYKLVFYGDEKLGGPDWINLPSNVEPQATIDLSVTLQAPEASGRYHSAWALASAPGDAIFGIGPAADKPFWVEIVVSNTTQTYTDSQLGLVFDYPSTWYVRPTPLGVSITSYDPAHPPHKLEWTPSTVAMSIQIAELPSGSSQEAWVEKVKRESAAAYLDIVAEERLTIAGSPAARIRVGSGSGGIFDYILIGDSYEVGLQGGNFDAARTVLDTLRRP